VKEKAFDLEPAVEDHQNIKTNRIRCLRMSGRTVNRHDLVSGLFWLGISIYVSVMAMQLGIGVLANPGPGFVLFCSSGLFGILSIVLIIKTLLKKDTKRILADSWRDLKWTHVLVTVLGLFLYASFLRHIGFLIMTFAFMALLYALGKVKPWISVAGAFVTILLAYLVFHFALQVQFPRGILGW
jgi:putative tricarboxylic transport membrane protein